MYELKNINFIFLSLQKQMIQFELDVIQLSWPASPQKVLPIANFGAMNQNG